jgi:hypothetical protein
MLYEIFGQGENENDPYDVYFFKYIFNQRIVANDQILSKIYEYKFIPSWIHDNISTIENFMFNLSKSIWL